MTPQAGRIFDVIDDFAECVDPRRLIARIGELRDRIDAFYRVWSPPPRAVGEIRLLPATTGWHALTPMPSAQATSADTERREYMSGLPHVGRAVSVHAAIYGGAFLYADCVVDLAYPGLFGDRDDLNRHVSVSDYLSLLQAMRPLIETGALLVVRPDVSAPEASERAARDTHPFANWLNDREREINFYWDAIWTWDDLEWQIMRLRYEFALAASSQASLLPTHAWEWEYIAYLGRDPLRATATTTTPSPHLKVASALAAVELPLLIGMSPATLARIRTEQDAFVEWRIALRNAARLIHERASSANFADEAQSVFEDLLLAKASEVTRTVSRSRSMRMAVAAQPLRVGLGAVFGAATSASLGLSLTGAITSAAAGGLANVAYAAFRPDKPQGAAAIMSYLMQDR